MTSATHSLREDLRWWDDPPPMRPRVAGGRLGIEAVDTVLNGVRGVVVVTGAPGLGVTAVLLHAVRTMAVRDRRPVLLLRPARADLSEPPEVALRLLAAESDADRDRLRRGSLGHDERVRVTGARLRLDQAPVRVGSPFFLSTVSAAAAVARAQPCDVVVLDQLDHPPGEADLVELVREFNLSLLLVGQREQSAAPWVTPGVLEQADAVLHVRRPRAHDPGAGAHDLHVDLVVHRHGPLTGATVAYDPATDRITDPAASEPDPRDGD